MRAATVPLPTAVGPASTTRREGLSFTVPAAGVRTYVEHRKRPPRAFRSGLIETRQQLLLLVGAEPPDSAAVRDSDLVHDLGGPNSTDAG